MLSHPSILTDATRKNYNKRTYALAPPIFRKRILKKIYNYGVKKYVFATDYPPSLLGYNNITSFR